MGHRLADRRGAGRVTAQHMRPFACMQPTSVSNRRQQLPLHSLDKAQWIPVIQPVVARAGLLCPGRVLRPAHVLLCAAGGIGAGRVISDCGVGSCCCCCCDNAVMLCLLLLWRQAGWGFAVASRAQPLPVSVWFGGHPEAAQRRLRDPCVSSAQKQLSGDLISGGLLHFV